MTDQAPSDGTMRYSVREVVGVFPDLASLEKAVQQLEENGVDRAAISVLGVSSEAKGEESAQAIEDDPSAPRLPFVSRSSLTEGKAFAVSLPMQVGGFAGAWAVAATGGALAAAIGATLAGGAVGAGLGALLVRAVARHHAGDIHARLGKGEAVIWVSAPDDAAERQAIDVLTRCNGSFVHAHTVEREWGLADRPLHDAQPDPFLEKDARLSKAGAIRT